MAAEVFGDPITVTGTATHLTSGLGIDRKFFAELTIRAKKENAGRIWLGRDSTLTTTTNQIGYLDPGEFVSFSLAAAFMHTSSIYLIAESSGDVVYVLGLS